MAAQQECAHTPEQCCQNSIQLGTPGKNKNSHSAVLPWYFGEDNVHQNSQEGAKLTDYSYASVCTGLCIMLAMFRTLFLLIKRFNLHLYRRLLTPRHLQPVYRE